MKQTKITVNLQGLENFTAAMTKQYRARVGVIGDGVARDDGPINNPTLGVIQMFGSVSRKIPPRDFLVMPIQLNGKKIVADMNKSQLVKKAIDAQDYKRIFQLLGATAEKYVQKAFETAGFGQWPANKPSTIQAKGSSAPLIDTGQLRRSISSDVAKP